MQVACQRIVSRTIGEFINFITVLIRSDAFRRDVCVIQIFTVLSQRFVVHIGHSDTDTPINHIVYVTANVEWVLIDISFLAGFEPCAAGSALAHQSLKSAKAIGRICVICHISLKSKDIEPAGISVKIRIVVVAEQQPIGCLRIGIISSGIRHGCYIIAQRRAGKIADTPAVDAVKWCYSWVSGAPWYRL